MNKRHVAGNFELDVSKDNAILYYKDEIFIEGCDNIVELLLNMGIEENTKLDKLDLSEEDVEYLEKMLNKVILNGNNNCLRK